MGSNRLKIPFSASCAASVSVLSRARISPCPASQTPQGGQHHPFLLALGGAAVVALINCDVFGRRGDIDLHSIDEHDLWGTTKGALLKA
jgi:hypothetical protein